MKRSFPLHIYYAEFTEEPMFCIRTLRGVRIFSKKTVKEADKTKKICIKTSEESRRKKKKGNII